MVSTLLSIVLLLMGCAATRPIPVQKLEGIALESPRSPSAENVMAEIESVGADYVCLMPYGYLEDGAAEVSFDSLNWQWWGEGSEGIEQLIEEAHEADLRVMLKPHIWIGWGSYTGELSFDDPAEQALWNKSYRQYILHYAKQAEEQHVSIFCIGTELCMQLNDDPVFWSALIEDIRSIYRGHLTYAANWDCYQDFPFWAELDFIGIDAYFPICEDRLCSLEDALSGWQYWKSELGRIADSTSRPILFTEYGYRSKEGCLVEPWVSGTGEDGIANESQQALAYDALYNSVWQEPWFFGGFLWKWHCKEHLQPERRKKDYTPQGKSAMKVIKRQYDAQSLKKEEQ